MALCFKFYFVRVVAGCKCSVSFKDAESNRRLSAVGNGRARDLPGNVRLLADRGYALYITSINFLVYVWWLGAGDDAGDVNTFIEANLSQTTFRFSKISVENVLASLKKLDVSKSTGLDGIPAKLLKTAADGLCMETRLNTKKRLIPRNTILFGAPESDNII